MTKKKVIRKLAWIHRQFLSPNPRPPDFKPDWRRWY